MQHWLLRAAGLAVLALVSSPVAAFEAREGCFVADRSCPAPTSIRGSEGAGGVAVEPGRSYRLLGANKAAATHLQLRLPDASPSLRWVEIGCGHTVASCEAAGQAAAPAPRKGPRQYVLALSWQPAFCQGHPDKPECKSETQASFEASNLTLHGLWPQWGDYCGASPEARALDRAGRWSELPAVTLSAGTRSDLQQMMPGTRSALERHEWLRHGACDGAQPEDYFKAAVRLAREVDASSVRALFAGHEGEQVTLDQLRAAVDAEFGAGAGSRAGLVCVGNGPGRLVTEVRLSLAGAVDGTGGLRELLATAPPARESCPSGRVDEVGRSG